MREGVEALTERERETLRLLLAGHDAKSVSRDLGLSIHTVNERLRDARRKLGVSSSREAARLLAEVEKAPSNNLGDRQLRVSAASGHLPSDRPPGPFSGAGLSLAWFGGGMLLMSLLLAASILLPVLHPGTASHTAFAPGVSTDVTSPNEAASAGVGVARAWVTLLDGQHWRETWSTAGTLFQAQMPETRWASVIQPVRQPLGTVSSRTFQSVTKATMLPGAPAGDYEIVQFRTDFASKHGATETVVLAHEGAGWKVDGYFIR